jgi:hypothetical protein
MRLTRLAALFFVLLAASCAVRHESPNGITVEVDAHQPEAAIVAAREHCEKYGKKAVQSYASDPAPSPRMFFLDSQIVSFDCVAK